MQGCQRQTWHWETSPWDLGAAVPENLSEGAGEEGGDADTETRRALAQCKVQQRAVVHLPGWHCWGQLMHRVIQHSLQRVS